jgi:Kef-type K+ transport system membrane component KefB
MSWSTGWLQRAVSFRDKTASAYAMLLSAAIAFFFVVRARGEHLLAPVAEPSPAPSAAPAGHVLLHVLLSLLVVILASRALGALFRHLHQPPVIGEVLAGVLLGPSLLGRISPGLQTFILPEQIAPQLGLLSQIGILLFLFLVGLELDSAQLRKKARATLFISHSSMVVPFLAGATLALWLYPSLSTREVGFTNFALFMGISLCVTAFPVLARILSGRGMQKSPLGVIALACAAIDDVTAWCLFALIVAIARAETGGAALRTIVLGLLYVWFMLKLMRPVVRRLIAGESSQKRSYQHVTAAVLVGLFASALVTEAIGVHALFGAFLFGAIIPHDSLLARHLNHRLRDLVIVLFLPAFFSFTGLRMNIGLLQPSDLAYGAAIIAVACAGKFGGGALAARGAGLPWRDACGLGILMNTRGLMELIVLHVGLDLGVISPRLFALLVIMAVVTTLATSPLLNLAQPSAALTPRLAPARGT